MQRAGVIYAPILALIGLSCSRMPESGSEARSLAELALGQEGGKACSGSFASAGFADKIIYADGVDSGAVKPSLDAALTAVPMQVRELFRAVGGQILVSPEASTLCASPSAAGKSASSCFKVGGKDGGVQEDVTIVLAPEAAVASSRTVRAFGYVVAQYFSRLYKKNGALELKLGMNQAFRTAQAEVGAAFLEDLNVQSTGLRGSELSSRAYAEAFDSWYCQANGPDDMHVRYPKTHAAFAKVDASVRIELARALATFQKKKASLMLQDSTGLEPEKINGDRSQAAVTDVTSATSTGSDPLISGSSAPATTEVKTFTDPAPTTPQSGKPPTSPNDVVVTINADGTVSGAGTDNIADGQLVIVDNREKPTTEKPTTDKPEATPSQPDSPEVPTDFITGGTQPGGADQGSQTSEPAVASAEPAVASAEPAGESGVQGGNFDSYQPPAEVPSTISDGGGQVFAGSECL